MQKNGLKTETFFEHLIGSNKKLDLQVEYVLLKKTKLIVLLFFVLPHFSILISVQVSNNSQRWVSDSSFVNLLQVTMVMIYKQENKAEVDKDSTHTVFF